MIKIKVNGVESTIKSLNKLGKVGQDEAKKAVRASLEMVRTTAIKDIQRGTKTGRVYERAAGSNLSRVHQASAAGEAPATDTGRLVSSIKVEQMGLSGSVGTDLEYAKDLEFGTFRVAARPFLRPALNNNQTNIIKVFEAALAKAVKAVK